MKISRREFLKYCISSAVVLGIDESTLGKLSKALANNGPQVLWLTGSSCTGCTVSLANLISTSAPVDVADLLINVINLDYHVNLMGAAGDQAVQQLRNIAAGSYILVVEGGIPSAFNGNACILWNENGKDVTALAAVRDLASHSLANISIGTCASFGGVAAAAPNPTQVTSFSTAIGKPTINIPGCPTHPDWIVWTVAQLLAGTTPALDSYGRPSTLFSGENNNVHENCPRHEREHASQYGVPDLCLSELGCKGPSTQADCPRRRWNNKNGTCVDANSLCIGCTESRFPDGFAPIFKVATTSTIPAQAPLAVNSASWDTTNLVLAAAGTGKIGSQAVVRTSAGALLASRMIGRSGTWSVSTSGLATVPSSIVVQSEGQSVTASVSNAPAGQTFAITSAQYTASTNQLAVAGTGKAGSSVTVSVTGGITLGAVTIPTNGNWLLTVTSPSPVPTGVTAVSDGVTRTATVTGIPAATLAITTAAYTASTNQITVSGTGTAGATVNISVTGGASLGSTTVASGGTWTRTVTSPTPIPTSVTAVSNGVTRTASVTGIPAAKPFAITTAAWLSSSTTLQVNGTGAIGAAVVVKNPAGTTLGSATINSSGNWSVNVANPAAVPQTVSATCNGATLTATVQNYQSLTVAQATWSRRSRNLTVAGNGTAGKTVSIYNNDTGSLLGTSTITSSSSWSRTINISRAPQVVRVESNGQTVNKTVTRLSGSHD